MFSIQNGKKYVDESFPAAPESISKDSRNRLSKLYAQWLPPDTIKQSKGEETRPWVIYGNPTPDDISQGQLGDCW